MFLVILAMMHNMGEAVRQDEIANKSKVVQILPHDHRLGFSITLRPGKADQDDEFDFLWSTARLAAWADSQGVE